MGRPSPASYNRALAVAGLIKRHIEGDVRGTLLWQVKQPLLQGFTIDHQANRDLFAIIRAEIDDAGGEFGTHASDDGRLIHAHFLYCGVAARIRRSDGDHRHLDLWIDAL